MTKIINFNEIEFLPALLSKEKTQIIEPAWNKWYNTLPNEVDLSKHVKYVKSQGKWNSNLSHIICSAVELLHKSKTQTIRPAWRMIRKFRDDMRKYPEEKPPKYKVGEEVKLVWHEGSEFDCFCFKCGSSFDIHWMHCNKCKSEEHFLQNFQTVDSNP